MCGQPRNIRSNLEGDMVGFEQNRNCKMFRPKTSSSNSISRLMFCNNNKLSLSVFSWRASPQACASPTATSTWRAACLEWSKYWRVTVWRACAQCVYSRTSPTPGTPSHYRTHKGFSSATDWKVEDCTASVSSTTTARSASYPTVVYARARNFSFEELYETDRQTNKRTNERTRKPVILVLDLSPPKKN